MALDPITGILNIIDDVVTGVSADQKAKLALKLQELQQQADQDKEQADIDANEASNANLFVSGARPFIMWGLGSMLVLYAFLVTGCNFAMALHYNVTPMPTLDPMIRDLVLGMLGLSHITRTYEKIKGVQGKH